MDILSSRKFHTEKMFGFFQSSVLYTILQNLKLLNFQPNFRFQLKLGLVKVQNLVHIIFGFEPFTKMLNLNNIQGSHTHTIENTQVLKIIGQRPLETEISNFELNFFRNFVTSPQPYNACLYARYFLLNFKLQSWTPNTTISYEKSLPVFFLKVVF